MTSIANQAPHEDLADDITEDATPGTEETEDEQTAAHADDGVYPRDPAEGADNDHEDAAPQDAPRFGLDPLYGRPPFPVTDEQFPDGTPHFTAMAPDEADAAYADGFATPDAGEATDFDAAGYEAAGQEEDNAPGILDLPDDGPGTPHSAGDYSQEYVGDYPFAADGQHSDEEPDLALAPLSDFSLQESATAGQGPDETIGALADAVQSALRTIYGDDAALPDAQPLLPPDAAPLDLLRSGMGDPFANPSPSDAGIWSADHGYDDGIVKVSAAELDDTTTEAVLSYLYQNTGPIGTPEGSRHTARNSFGETDYGRSPGGQDRADADMPLHSAAGYTAAQTEPSYYRGPALRAPQHAIPQTGPEKGKDGPARDHVQGSGTLAAGYAKTADSAIITFESDEQNGRVLGAAGIGLIGGVALAGVLAVFLFNSFVTDPGTGNRTGAGQPRLALDPGVKSPSRLETAGSEKALLPALLASDVDASSGGPVPLNIALMGQVQPDEVLVTLRGLPEGARLSSGVDAGGGAWLLPPQRLEGLRLSFAAPPNGNAIIEAQLLQSDTLAPISQPVTFMITTQGAAAGANISEEAVLRALAALEKGRDGEAVATALPRPAPQPFAPALGQGETNGSQLLREGNRLMRDGDILAARKLYEQAYELGEADGALAMGRSYDPTYFEQIEVKTGKPDPALAFEWYRKAMDKGIDTARVKIDGLKEWLQR